MVLPIFINIGAESSHSTMVSPAFINVGSDSSVPIFIRSLSKSSTFAVPTLIQGPPGDLSQVSLAAPSLIDPDLGQWTTGASPTTDAMTPEGDQPQGFAVSTTALQDTTQLESPAPSPTAAILPESQTALLSRIPASVDSLLTLTITRDADVSSVSPSSPQALSSTQ